jgi:hypothetical protein
MKARSGVDVELYSFFNLGARWGRVVSATPRPLNPREGDPVLIVQEAGRTTGPVWASAENFAPTEIRSPDSPARSELLYQLRYPSPPHTYDHSKNVITLYYEVVLFTV